MNLWEERYVIVSESAIQLCVMRNISSVFPVISMFSIEIGVINVIDLPIYAFCLHGINGEKIELTIDEVYGFPESTSIEGGYDFTGKHI